MLKNIKIIIIGVAISILLTACDTGNVSVDRKQQIFDELTERNMPVLEKWFSDNIPDAEIIEAEEVSDLYYISLNVINGTYLLDSNNYNFCFDAEKEEMLTSEHFEEYKDVLNETFENVVGINAENVDVFPGGEHVTNKKIYSSYMNKDNIDEMEYSTETYGDISLQKWNLTSEEMQEKAEGFIDGPGLNVDVDVTDFGEVEKILCNEEFLKYHPGLKLYVKVPNGGEDFYDDYVGRVKTILGEPYDTGDIPYAENNGGSILFSRYKSDYYLVEMKSAGERDYIEICIETPYPQKD